MYINHLKKLESYSISQIHTHTQVLVLINLRIYFAPHRTKIWKQWKVEQRPRGVQLRITT